MSLSVSRLALVRLSSVTNFASAVVRQHGHDRHRVPVVKDTDRRRE